MKAEEISKLIEEFQATLGKPAPPPAPPIETLAVGEPVLEATPESSASAPQPAGGVLCLNPTTKNFLLGSLDELKGMVDAMPVCEGA